MLNAKYANDIRNSMEINDGEVLQEVSDLEGEVDRQQGNPAHSSNKQIPLDIGGDVPVNDDDGQKEGLITTTSKESNGEDMPAIHTASDKDTGSNLHHTLQMVSNDNKSNTLFLVRFSISGVRSVSAKNKQERGTCCLKTNTGKHPPPNKRMRYGEDVDQTQPSQPSQPPLPTT